MAKRQKKLTKSVRRSIVYWLSKGVTCAHLARKYDVTTQAIWLVKKEAEEEAVALGNVSRETFTA